MNTITLNDVFDSYLAKIKYDESFYKKIKQYRLAWAQKGDIYIEFLGSNLTGVHPIRFSSLDDAKFFVDLINVDQTDLQQDLYKVTGINKDWNVTSNAMYLTLFYFMHQYTNAKLPEKIKTDCIKELYYIFAYKAVSSLITEWFKYSTSPALAKAAYERLSNRFLIKRFGTWQNVFEYRAGDLLPPKGLHYKRLISGTAEDAISVISDMQGRLRDNIKNYYAVLNDVKEKNEKINSSSIIGFDYEDGKEVFKDLPDRPDSYILYVRNIIGKTNDFIVDDLIHLMSVLSSNLDAAKFTAVLKYISSDPKIYSDPKNDFIAISIQNTMAYTRSKGITGEYNKRTLEILKMMKGYWSSSSVKDADVKNIKKYLYDIASKAINSKTKSLISTISISILLYIFLRSLYKK